MTALAEGRTLCEAGFGLGVDRVFVDFALDVVPGGVLHLHGIRVDCAFVGPSPPKGGCLLRAFVRAWFLHFTECVGSVRIGMSAPNSTSRTASRDVVIAIRSAFTLGGSLVATWAIAMVVRIFLPRHLGPELFGTYNFAESFTATAFVFLQMGMDIYIRKEVSVRPEHASDFFGGIVVIRLAVSVLLFGLMAAVLSWMGRPAEVQRVVFVFGIAQFLFVLTENFAALLQASRQVVGLAVVNVVHKILWGAGVAAAILLDGSLEAMAGAFLFSMLFRAIALLPLLRRHLHLRFTINARSAFRVIVISLPFYLNAVAYTIYGKLDVSLMSGLANDREVGWYGCASNFAGLALLITPLIGSVLMPLLSRAAADSEARLNALLRRAIEAVLGIAIPVSLMMGVGADTWIGVLFGPEFANSVSSLRILAPVFVITYIATLLATSLILLERAWTVTVVSLTGLGLNLVLNLLVVPYALRRFGEGGAGIGAASVMIVTELSVAVAFLVLLGGRSFDRRSAIVVLKSVGAVMVVIGIDWLMSGLGAARLLLDALAYGALVLATGAVRPKEVAELVRTSLARKAAGADA
ncbi:MAG: oligosaccharide flippase family protein [Polyangiaceae bacterium]|nr:oligosaccharide flippase family protein [Polyangiaceae bacterium]